MVGSIETKPAEIQPAILAEGAVIARRVLIHDFQKLPVHSSVQRVHPPDFIRRKGLDLAVRRLELQKSQAQTIRRNRARLCHAAGVRALLIVEEEKCPVADNSTAKRRSELIPNE